MTGTTDNNFPGGIGLHWRHIQGDAIESLLSGFGTGYRDYSGAF